MLIHVHTAGLVDGKQKVLFLRSACCRWQHQPRPNGIGCCGYLSGPERPRYLLDDPRLPVGCSDSSTTSSLPVSETETGRHGHRHRRSCCCSLLPPLNHTATLRPRPWRTWARPPCHHAKRVRCWCWSGGRLPRPRRVAAVLPPMQKSRHSSTGGKGGGGGKVTANPRRMKCIITPHRRSNNQRGS